MSDDTHRDAKRETLARLLAAAARFDGDGAPSQDDIALLAEYAGLESDLVEDALELADDGRDMPGKGYHGP